MARAAAATAAPARAPRPARPARPARRVSGTSTARKRASGTRRLPLGARLLDALLSGRVWIGLVGVLLAGIVFFNVDLMRMNREITHMADEAAQYKRENAGLRQDVAQLANSERIQEAAAQLGLVLPQPDQVRYLKSNPRVDAKTAAKRIIAPTSPTTLPTTATTLPTTTTATAASPTG